MPGLPNHCSTANSAFGARFESDRPIVDGASILRTGCLVTKATDVVGVFGGGDERPEQDFGYARQMSPVVRRQNVQRFTKTPASLG